MKEFLKKWLGSSSKNATSNTSTSLKTKGQKMLSLGQLQEGKIYQATDKAPKSWFFTVIQGKLHSDQGRNEGNIEKALKSFKNEAWDAGRNSNSDTSLVFGACTYVHLDAKFNEIGSVSNNGASITQGVANMKEGVIYNVTLLTGKKVTVDEKVKGKVVTMGGKTYRVSHDKVSGEQKLRPLKSKISTKTEPTPVKKTASPVASKQA